jgi:hypothetical protein
MLLPPNIFISILDFFGTLKKLNLLINVAGGRGGQRSVMGGFGPKNSKPNKPTDEKIRPNFTQVRFRFDRISV